MHRYVSAKVLDRLRLRWFADPGTPALALASREYHPAIQETAVQLLDKLAAARAPVIATDLGGGYQGVIPFSTLLEALRKNKLLAPADQLAETHEPLGTAATLNEAWKALDSSAHGFIPVTNQGRPVAVLKRDDLLKAIRQPMGLRSEEAMACKPFHVTKQTPLAEAVRMFAELRQPLLPVLGKGRTLEGVVTAGSLLGALRLNGWKMAGTAGAATEADAAEVGPDSDLSLAAYHARKHGAALVVQDGRLFGMVTAQEILETVRV